MAIMLDENEVHSYTIIPSLLWKYEQQESNTSYEQQESKQQLLQKNAPECCAQLR